MKKFLALATLVLGLASCQTEPEGFDVNVGGAVDTVVTVNIPDAETRANDSGIGVFENGVLDGDATMRYIFQVYYNGETNTESRQVKYADGTSVSFPVRLVPGRNYQFVVWADVVTAENAGDNHYNTADLENITLSNPSTWVAMDETRDAFTATYEAKQYNGSQSINIDLYRPFAKLRVVTTDYTALANLGTGIKAAKATVKYATDHRSAFNAYTSEAKAADKADVEHTQYTIAEYTDEDDASRTIFSDYFFAEEGDIVKFEMTVYDTNGQEIVTRVFNTDINVNRNYLTTIKGNILTDGNNVNVEVKPGFGDIEWPNTLAGELAKAAMLGGEVTLTEDVVLNEPLNVTANMVVNLGDYTISNANGYAFENSGDLTISANNQGGIAGLGGIRSNGGKVTINGGTYTGSSDWNNGTFQHLLKAVNTEVVINDGTFDATIGGITNALINVSEGSKVTINGGKFKNVDGAIPQFSPYLFTYEKNGKLIINDGEFYGGWRFNGESATTDIYGGDFTVGFDGQSFHASSTHVLTVYGGTFTPTSYANNSLTGKLDKVVADGYQALQYETNGFYTVQAIDAATRTITINSLEEYLNLNALNDKWVEFFSNGQGKEYSNYAPQNGGKGTDFYYKWRWTIKLNTDIDLKDVTALVPTNLESFGYFDGNGHTIKNATITTTSDAGLFRAGHAAVKNLNLYNIKVNGGNDASVGILTYDCHASVDNITIVNSSVEGGKYVGGAVGYGYCDVTNCTLTNCVVKGSYKFGGVIGYICASNENLGNVDNNTLTDCTVEWTGNYSSGKDTVVMGKVVGNFNCDGTCNGNVITNMTTSAKSLIGKIEAGMIVEGQNSATASNTDDLKEALKDNTVTEVSVTAGEYTFPASDIKAGTTIICEEGTVFKGNSKLNIDGATVIGATFSNPTGTAADQTINGTFKDCTFTGENGLRWCYAGETVVFENCVFEGSIYGVHFDGGANDVVFKNCVLSGFNALGGAITQLTLDGCTLKPVVAATTVSTFGVTQL